MSPVCLQLKLQYDFHFRRSCFTHLIMKYINFSDVHFSLKSKQPSIFSEGLDTLHKCLVQQITETPIVFSILLRLREQQVRPEPSSFQLQAAPVLLQSLDLPLTSLPEHNYSRQSLNFKPQNHRSFMDLLFLQKLTAVIT